MKLAFATDIHLDSCPAGRAKDFAFECAERADALVISGDIANQLDADLFADFAINAAIPIYFVLGNHDFWNGSFESAERYTRKICAQIPNLHWLTESSPIKLTDDVELCGVEGWYDMRFGDPERSRFQMMDWFSITDLSDKGRRAGGQTSSLRATCAAIADRYAAKAEYRLQKTTAKRVFFVTHIPPYEESAMHQGSRSLPEFMPFYSSKVMGLALSEYAATHPEQDITTLCGHVHSPSLFRQAPNHLVICGESEYGSPRIAEIFEL